MMRGKRGKVLASLLAVIGVAGLWWSGKRVLGKTDAAGISQTRWMICSETGKVFEGSIQRGSVFPLYSPYSKRQTGYPAERCFWTADGQIKSEPTFVLVKGHLGEKGPTFCPDCGRLVLVNNPGAGGGKAPPTQSEFLARNKEEE